MSYDWTVLCAIANLVKYTGFVLHRDPTCIASANTILALQGLRASALRGKEDPNFRLDSRIENFIHIFRHKFCKNPLDRIHSILSLAPVMAGGELILKPDYNFESSKQQKKLALASMAEY